MYRQDYDVNNKAPISDTARLYDANYYVINSDFNVYICISNGSSGEDLDGVNSKFEPTSTDLEPFSAGADGYTWKYLFSVSPSDIIKFDSTEYIVVPNNWETTTNSSIQSVREAGDSTVNFNQIKKIYIKNAGDGYENGPYNVDILGDGTGGKASITVDGGKITSAVITAGGRGYTYGMVDLGDAQPPGVPTTYADLIVIIPPSRGHGYDIYKELGADRVLVYARFDDSTKDFPVSTKFAQVGIVKNPSTYTSIGSTYSAGEYSSLGAIKLNDGNADGGTGYWSTTPTIGSKIEQSVTNGTAKGYVASYDKETSVLKYYQDRSLYYNPITGNQTDYIGITTAGKVLPFEASSADITFAGGSPNDTAVAIAFTGRTMTSGSKEIDLGVYFTAGLADPEINKTSGDILYIDNREEVARNIRQKEDIKIILEF